MAHRSPRSARRRWLRLVRLQARSGLAQGSFCRRRRISLHQFRAWKYKHLARDARSMKSTDPQPTGRRRARAVAMAGPAAPAFLPVRLVSPGASGSPAAPPPPPPTPAFEIVLRDGRRVVVPPSFDAEGLRELLTLLEARA